MDEFLNNVTPTFLIGLFIGFMSGAAISTAMVTIGWIMYGERRCKECGQDPDFNEEEI